MEEDMNATEIAVELAKEVERLKSALTKKEADIELAKENERLKLALAVKKAKTLEDVQEYIETLLVSK